MPTLSTYSELEYLILAMVDRGIKTGYAMRKAMAGGVRGKGVGPSLTRWSPDSGAVYRVLKRLCKDDLVREAARKDPSNRDKVEYELTGQGEALLNSWLTLPLPLSELGYLIDPMRTRCFFLGRLMPAEQEQVVRVWLESNRELCQRLEESLDTGAEADTLQAVAESNLLYLARARNEWLERLLVVITRQIPAQRPVAIHLGSAVIEQTTDESREMAPASA